MKKIIAFFVVMSFTSNVALATCDFSTGITKQPNGSFLYTPECHIAVGQMKADLDSANSQLTDYKKAITLKDLALTASEQRGDVWMNSTFTLQDRMNKVDSYQSKNNVLYFVGGILLTSLAVWGAGSLARK